jgi:predicted Zn-dependent protease with MMP-like domain
MPLYSRHTTPPTLEEIEALAEAALTTVPPELRQRIDNVVIRVEEFPDAETEREMGLESPFDLLGLYRGVDLSRRSLLDPPRGPDMVFLYRGPLLDYWCETGEDFAHLVRHVLIHEIGHHFGLSDEAMAAIEEASGPLQ